MQRIFINNTELRSMCYFENKAITKKFGMYS